MSEKESRAEKRARRKAEKELRKREKQGLSEETEETPDPFRPRTEEEITEELEDLRSKFQSEIDDMLAAHPDRDWNDIVKEAAMKKRNKAANIEEETTAVTETAEAAQTEEVIADTAAPETEGGENAVAVKTEDPKKFTWWSFLIPIIAVLFLAFAVLFTVQGWSVYSGTAVAQKRAMNHRPLSAITKYQEVNNLIDTSNGSLQYGTKYRKNQVKLYQELGPNYISYLNSFVSTHYSAKELKSPLNRYAKKQQQVYNDYAKLAEVYQNAMVSAAGNITTNDQKSLNKIYKNFIKEYDKQVADKEYDETYVEFFRWYASLLTSQSTDVQRSHLENIKKTGAKSLYYSLLTENYLSTKEWQNAIDTAEKSIKNNKEDEYAYAYKAYGQRMLNDLEGAEDTLNEGLKINSNSSSMNYQMAVISILNGQYKLAEDYALTAATYNTDEETVNLYALAVGLRAQEYQKKGDTKKYEDSMENYKSLESLLANNDASISPDVRKILDGSKTPAQVFLKGTGNIA